MTELAVGVLVPISQDMSKLSADPGFLDDVLAKGSERAKMISAPILKEVYDIVGFLGSKW